MYGLRSTSEEVIAELSSHAAAHMIPLGQRTVVQDVFWTGIDRYRLSTTDPTVTISVAVPV